MTKSIPLLLTVDVEIATDHNMTQQTKILDKLNTDLKSLPMTWFCTAVAAEEFSSPLKRLQEAGHEIGCHGLDHSKDDNYQRMSEDRANMAISEATDRITKAIGKRPRCFRGPRMTTSKQTQSALLTYGYQGDFSVCAQRIDLLTCGGANMLWLFAPRGAYHPSEKNPFYRGKMPLSVVNLSCLGVPFLSGILYLGGLRFMQRFFDALLVEARHTGNPIVYLFHSYEFAELTHPGGQPIHQRAYINDRNRRYEMNLELLQYMCRLPEVQPMTAITFLEKKHE